MPVSIYIALTVVSIYVLAFFFDRVVSDRGGWFSWTTFGLSLTAWFILLIYTILLITGLSLHHSCGGL